MRLKCRPDRLLIVVYPRVTSSFCRSHGRSARALPPKRLSYAIQLLFSYNLSILTGYGQSKLPARHLATTLLPARFILIHHDESFSRCFDRVSWLLLDRLR